MKKTRILTAVLCVALIAAASMFWSCAGNTEVLGKGATSFKLEVVNDKSETKTFTIKTDEKTLDAALTHADVKLIVIDNGMVTTVDGLKADYDTDSTWWKLIVDGKESTVGVAAIEVVKDATYKFEFVKDSGDTTEDTGTTENTDETEDTNETEAE